MAELGKYLQQQNEEWQETVQRASVHNSWFLPEFCNAAAQNIATHFLQVEKLGEWAAHYHLDDNISPKNVGIVMAGNIPMVGFHDMLCGFISGHRQTMKLSSKDEILMKHLVQKLYELNPEISSMITIADNLKGCDAYIATGSNNTARYFEQYFGKYPNIIRSNKTSVAVITGEENEAELEALSDDIHMYFGLGCRNVTKIYVPEDYDFIPLLASFNKYSHFADFNKYKNNLDFQLSLLLLNRKYYMTNGSTLLVENELNFSAISVLNYMFYKSGEKVIITRPEEIQCVVGRDYIPFGNAQQPHLFNYADQVDTMQFLLTIG